MSTELDLRSVHRAHEPDPAFVTALEQRLDAILTGTAPAGSPPGDDGPSVDLDRPAAASHAPPRSRARRFVLGAAAAVVLMVVVGALVRREEDPAADLSTTATDPPATAALDGWVAFDSDQTGGDDIYLVRAGEPPRRVTVPGSDTADETCPAFAPDGDRLLFGRAKGGDAAGSRDSELVIVGVAGDGSVSPVKTIPLDGMDGEPCAIWAPDGRWAAFGGVGAVWVVDTVTSEVRQLPGRDPSDLEWRPGTDELAITGHVAENVASDAPIEIYSVSTGEIRAVGDVRASNLTWSPDGTTIAFTHGEDQPASGIWLVDTDGSNERQLVVGTDDVLHGIGVTWSPRGDWIAFQEVCEQPPEVRYEEENPDEDVTDMVAPALCREEHEVVLLSATTDDPANPFGTRVVIPPPQTEADGRPRWWFPFSVTWSPDGTHLLYTAWTDGTDGPGGVIAVPIDAGQPPVVLTEEIGPGVYDGTPWVPLQQWRRP